MNNATVAGIVAAGIALGGTLGYAAASRTAAAPKAATDSFTCSADGVNQATTADVIEINGKKFASDDLPADVRSAIYEAQHESHEKIAWTLKEFALRFALSEAKGAKPTPDKLPPLQDLLPAAKPDEATMKALFEANKGQMPPGTTFEQVKPQIEQYLAQQSRSSAMQAKLAELEKAGKVKVLLKEPVAPVMNLDLEGLPSQGPKDAKVTLVEASDYLCGYCKKMQPEVEAVTKEFAGKIRFVQANFALNQSGLSGTLAQGAYCAQKQSADAFWKFHHEAYGANQVQPADATKEALAIAQKAGVKNAAFEKCLGSQEAKTFVASTVEKMSAVGVSGTPTFFLNGRKLGHNGSLKGEITAALAQ